MPAPQCRCNSQKHIDLVAIEIELVDKVENREYMLKQENIKEEYDYIIIDCAPFSWSAYVKCLNCCRLRYSYSM
jgi:cellulose biosynthesis protein BcsQ